MATPLRPITNRSASRLASIRFRPPRMSRFQKADWSTHGERQALIALVDRTMKDISLIVSARGICALQAGEIARLPEDDLDLLASSCACASCSQGRLH